MRLQLLFTISILLGLSAPVAAQILPVKTAPPADKAVASSVPTPSDTCAATAKLVVKRAISQDKNANESLESASPVIQVADKYLEPTDQAQPSWLTSAAPVDAGGRVLEQAGDTSIIINTEHLGESADNQTRTKSAPLLSPAPMLEDQTTVEVPGVKTSGTVRQQGLQNAECLLNVVANGIIVLGIAWAGPSLMVAFFRLGASDNGALKGVMHVILALLGLIAMPAVINWLVASGRDAGIFTGM